MDLSLNINELESSFSLSQMIQGVRDTLQLSVPDQEPTTPICTCWF